MSDGDDTMGGKKQGKEMDRASLETVWYPLKADLEEVSQWSKLVSGLHAEGTKKCQGPEAGVGLASSRRSTEDGTAGRNEVHLQSGR